MQSSWTPFPRTATQPGAVSRFFGGKRCKTSKIVLRIRNGRKEWRIIGGAILASIHHPGLRFFDEKNANQGDGWVSKMTKFGFSKPRYRMDFDLEVPRVPTPRSSVAVVVLWILLPRGTLASHGRRAARACALCYKPQI